MEENKYYVYLHIKEDTGEPFYVGKGKDNKRRRYESKHGRSEYWKRIVDKHRFDIIFLEIDLTNEEALEREVYWIERIGRKDLGKGPLVNFTDGGEGCVNMSDETKAKMSIVAQNRIYTDERKKNCSIAQMGNTNRRGKTATEETRKLIGESKIGNTNMLGKIHSDETKKKISETTTGRKLTPEHCENIRLANLKRWAKYREDKN